MCLFPLTSTNDIAGCQHICIQDHNTDGRAQSTLVLLLGAGSSTASVYLYKETEYRRWRHQHMVHCWGDYWWTSTLRYHSCCMLQGLYISFFSLSRFNSFEYLLNDRLCNFSLIYLEA